jgi:hypothetical protein
MNTRFGTGETGETQVIEARRLRDAARGIVYTDLATLRHGLADRPLTSRVRERVIAGVVDTFEDGVALADENRLVLGLTLAALAGWLFRNRLGGLGQTVFAWAERAVAHFRD